MIRNKLSVDVAITGLGKIDYQPENPAGTYIHLKFQPACRNAMIVTIELHRKIGNEKECRAFEYIMPAEGMTLFRTYVMAKRALSAWLDGKSYAPPEVCSKKHGNGFAYILANAIYPGWGSSNLLMNMDMSIPTWKEVPLPVSPRPLWRPF